MKDFTKYRGIFPAFGCFFVIFDTGTTSAFLGSLGP